MFGRSAREARERADERKALIEFLGDRAEAIARKTADMAVPLLPVGGRGAKKLLRGRYERQVRELARLLSTYGVEEGPHLFGELQRPAAKGRLDEGLSLHEALEETRLFFDGILAEWAEQRGPMPPEVTSVVGLAYAEAAGQTAEVWLAHFHAEGAAFQEAALLETIVHHLDEAILVLEADGTVSYATPAIEAITDLRPAALVGSGPEAFANLLRTLSPRLPGGRSLEPEHLPHAETLRTRAPAAEEAVEVTRRSGAEAVLAFNAAPVFDEDGEFRGVIVTVRDRTERVRHLRELEEANERLKSMYARILSRSRLEAVGELAGRTAHALNNQLNAIGLRVRRLREVEETAADAEAIGRSVREIAALVARLQELASTHPPGEPELVDVDAICQEALDLNRTEIGPATSRRVEVHLGGAGAGFAERESLLELISTLLLAARDTTPPGGTLHLETEGRDDHVAIRVADEGPGLPPEALERIFEPFAPGQEAAGRVLTLAAGRQAAERWGGQLAVRVRAGGGTVFEIRLPRAGVREAVAEAARAEEEAAPPAERAAPPPAEPREIHRVLVVDDDEDNAEMLADLLRDSGAEPAVVKTGHAALDALRADGGYDAALVDLLLPDVNGWEVVRALKDRKPQTRVAVVSGLAAGREPEAKMADAVFRKPLEPDRLLDFLGLGG